MRLQIVQKIRAMRSLREFLIEERSAGTAESEMCEKACANFGINNYTLQNYDLAIAEIDGLEPILTSNRVRLAKRGHGLSDIAA